MTKYWEPGRVKTRLGAEIGMRRAAAIHREFVRHLLETLQPAGWKRILCYTPPGQRAVFERELANRGAEAWQLQAQVTGDLGHRMRSWFVHWLNTQQAPTAILIGSDCPTVAQTQIAEAYQRLETHDVVIGPAYDGGYYLIGIRGPWRSGNCGHDALFHEIAWSSDRVASQTRQRAAEAGLSIAELSPHDDIDTEANLANFHRGEAERSLPLASLCQRISQILSDSSFDDSDLL